MKAEDEVAYLQRRAEEELGQAQRSANPKAVAAHYELAELYLARIAGDPAGSEPAGGLPAKQ